MNDKTTILIVDDEPVGREALEGVLFAQGYNLIFAENGAEAIQKAVDETPDLVLLDVMMPHMDGFAVCQLMRRDPLLAEMPIVMLTALDDRESRLKGIEVGADDFITKPYDRIELRARIRTITRLNRYRRLLIERARFVWVIDQATEGYLIFNDQGKITFTNPAAQTLLSLPLEGQVEEPFWEYVQKFYVCEPEEAWTMLAQTGSVERALYLIHPEDEVSQMAWLMAELVQFPANGTPSTLVRLTEITSNIIQEPMIRRFHSRVSHKLLTPIVNIRMSADILVHQLNLEGKGEFLELPNVIINNTKRLKVEIDDLLSYLQNSAYTDQGDPFYGSDLQDLVVRICQEVGISQFSVKIAQDLEQIRFKLSNKAITVVMSEILENAKKFHPNEKPVVDIQASCLSKNTEELKYIHLTIRDNGIHLSPNQLGKVWDPYYQAEKIFTGEVPGLGLGLSTVSNLMWSCGGKCRLVNRVDHPGVLVELIIPIYGFQSDYLTQVTAKDTERISK